MTFTLKFDDNRTTYFCPFHTCANSVSPFHLNQHPATTNNDNHSSKEEADCCSNSPISIEEDAFSGDNNNLNEREDNSSSSSLPNRMQKQVRFVNDGYCTKCNQQFQGQRGLAIHKRKKHQKYEYQINSYNMALTPFDMQKSDKVRGQCIQ